jgi:ubiquinone/menaquinone biosynthesis C-methylase UbiE
MDISDTMVSLAKERLARFGDRAKIILTDGSPRLDFRADAFDWFVSCYVLDLMAFGDIRKVLLEANRILSTGGLLCLVSLTHGFNPITRIVEHIWPAIFNFRPKLVGGCRPVSLFEFIPEPFWRILFHEKFSSFGIPSEVLAA